MFAIYTRDLFGQVRNYARLFESDEAAKAAWKKLEAANQLPPLTVEAWTERLDPEKDAAEIALIQKQARLAEARAH